MDNHNDDILSYAAEYLLWKQKRARRNKIIKVLIVLAVLGVLCVCAYLYSNDWYVMSRKNSDVEKEFREEWKNEAEHVDLTGDWSEDVLAIAESQVGYTESNDEDWSAVFVSFCLSYAKVKSFPLETECNQWVQKLRKRKDGIYRDASKYTPTSGDLIFLDMNDPASRKIADHVGIVAEVIPATDVSCAKIKTVEGDTDDSVNYVIYDLTDIRIIGYGKIPDAR